MKLTCDEIASATGLLPAKTSGKEILFHCPNHEDKHPSLSINLDKNTWICGPCGQAGTAWKFAAFLARCDPSDKAAVTAYLGRIGVFNGSASGKPPDKIYSYRDENGTLLYQVLRFDGAEGKKRFSQRAPDGNGGWHWNLNGVRRVLYKLPELISELKEKRPEMVYVAEGEKDVDALREHEMAATTNPGGAGKWRAEYSEQLRASGSECIVIFPDNDEAGEKHALSIAGFCRTASLRVKIVKLPGLPPKGDVSDFFNSGHTEGELEEMARGDSEAQQHRQRTGDAGSGGAPACEVTGTGVLAQVRRDMEACAFGLTDWLFHT